MVHSRLVCSRFALGSFKVRYMFATGSLVVSLSTVKVRSWFFKGLLQVCSWFVNGILQVRSWFVNSMLQVCSQYTPGLL